MNARIIALIAVLSMTQGCVLENLVRADPPLSPERQLANQLVPGARLATLVRQQKSAYATALAYGMRQREEHCWSDLHALDAEDERRDAHAGECVTLAVTGAFFEEGKAQEQFREPMFDYEMTLTLERVRERLAGVGYPPEDIEFYIEHLGRERAIGIMLMIASDF